MTVNPAISRPLINARDGALPLFACPPAAKQFSSSTTNRRFGAEVAKLEGDDVAREIIRFAREKGISLVVIGQTHSSWWRRLRHGSVTERIIENGDGLDVMVVAVAHAVKPA